jgi:hypothetical protein
VSSEGLSWSQWESRAGEQRDQFLQEGAQRDDQ